MQLHWMTIPFFLSTFLSVFLGIYALRNRRVQHALNFSVLMFAVAIWTSTYAMDISSVSVEGKLFWAKAKYFGSTTAPALWLWLSFQITGRTRWLTRPVRFAIIGWVALTIVIVLTNDFHQWYWQEFKVVPGVLESVVVHGPYYDIFLYFNYLSIFGSSAVYLDFFFRTTKQFRLRALVLVFAAFVPLIAHLFQSYFGVKVFDQIDSVPLMIMLSGLILGYAIFRLNVLKVLPIARDLVIEEIDTGIIVLDTRNHVIEMNPAALRFTRHKTPTDQPLAEVIPELENLTVVNGTRIEQSISIRGEERFISVSVSIIFEKEIMGHVLVVHDISERRVAEVAATKARDEAEESNQAKSRFLANMSHEIRTPMNAIMGLTHLTLKTELEPLQRDYLTKVENAATSLLAIINDILDVSKIESGKVNLESIAFSVDQLVENLYSMFALRAEEQNVVLSIAKDTNLEDMLVGDSLRLGQVLINLINNAIKFSPNGKVLVKMDSISNTLVGEVTVRFSVQDNGIGLTTEQAEKLFQPFVQADSTTTRKFGGTGLGLVISQQLVELMGGQIEIRSEPDHGSEFFFSLKLATATENDKLAIDTQAAITTDANLTNARILVVDDSEINLIVAEGLVKEITPNVTTVLGAEDAIELLSEQSFDCILMDIQMPGIDGYMATKMIIESGVSTAPIIAMTADATLEDRQRAIDAGMVDHIPKPIEPIKLRETISHWLTKDEHQDDSRDVVANITIDPSAVEAAEINLPTTVEYIRVSEGLARLSGNTTLYIQLLEQFSRDFVDLPARLTDLHLERLINERNALSHKARGVSANLGIQIADLLSEIESSVGDDVSNQLNELANIFPKLLNSIQSLKNRAHVPSNPTTLQTETIDLSHAFNELEKAILENDSKSEALTLELKQYLAARPEAVEWKKFQETSEAVSLLTKAIAHLDDFEFAAALPLIAEAKEKVMVSSDDNSRAE